MCGDCFMNPKYLNDENVVRFSIKSDFGNMDEDIILPKTLVEDLQTKMLSLNEDCQVKHPFNNIILVALGIYMDYVHGDLVPFGSAENYLVKCSDMVG